MREPSETFFFSSALLFLIRLGRADWRVFGSRRSKKSPKPLAEMPAFLRMRMACASASRSATRV